MADDGTYQDRLLPVQGGMAARKKKVSLAVDTTAQGRSDGDVGSLGGDYETADVAV